jgi:predicted phage terminase large subunit-like protein
MESPWYRHAFPGTRLDREKNAELEFMTTARGYRLGTSVGGTLTGRGGNFVVIDDPMKPNEAMSDVKRESVKEWFDRTLYSRLDNKTEDVIILIMQRLHVDDLVGHVLAKSDDWIHLELPAIAEMPQRVAIGEGEFHERAIGDPLHPEREPRDTLDKIRAEIGSQVFEAQYQQCPLPPDGEIIRWSWFKFYDAEPARRPNDLLVQSWDTASKAEEINNYSVCTTWLIKENEYYLLDVFRDRLTYPDLKKRVIAHSLLHRATTILIEDKASGTALIQDIRRERIVGLAKPIAFKPEGDKVTRMHAQSAKIEAGHVLLPRRASWLDGLRSELLQFPYGRHDDQVDSLSQFLNWIELRRRGVPRSYTWGG